MSDLHPERCKICEWDSSAQWVEMAYRCVQCHTWLDQRTGEPVKLGTLADRLKAAWRILWR